MSEDSKSENKIVNPTGLRVEFYSDMRGDHRWTQYASNGKIRSASTEGFSTLEIAKVNWEEGYKEAQAISQARKVFFRSNGKRKVLDL